MREICGIIVPRQRDIVGRRDDGYIAECILERGHNTPHIIQTPEGQKIAWEDDFTCACCAPDEDDRCYTFWKVN